MKTETAVEFLIQKFDLEMQDTFQLDKINQAKEMEKNQKMDFANWCRIHDNKYPNTVMTIQQLYDLYEKTSELESINSSERKNTLSDYGVAGEDNSVEYANENTSDTESIQWTGDNLEEINEFLKKNNKHFKYLAQRVNDSNLIITKKDTGLDILWIGLNEYLVISNNKIILIPYGEMTNRPKKPQRKPIVQEELAPHNAPEEQNNEPMIQEAKIRLQTALDIFELQEWKMEAFGIRTPKEFEDYKEQRKQLYEKCKTIEQAEREKLIREACNVCKTEFRKFKKTTVEEVVNQVLNK